MPTRIELTRGAVRLVADRYGEPGLGTLLLLHAGGETRAVWRPVAEHLAGARWTLLAPDFRGHGESGRVGRYRLSDLAEDTLAWVDGSAPVVLAGGSLGGVVALRVAARLGDRVRGVVLLDIVPNPRAESGERERAKVVRARAARVAELAHLDPNTACLVDEVLDGRTDTSEAARALEVPALLLHGADSHVIGESEIRDFLDDVPHGEIQPIEGGHLLAREQPAAIATALARFLATIEPPE